MALRDFRKLAKAAAAAADDKKAVDIVVLDIRKESDVADYMMIAGAGSSPQMLALLDTVEDRLKELGIKALHREGRSRNRWLVLDYGGLVVHILSTEARQFYRLESLWEKARPVAWQKSVIPRRGQRPDTLRVKGNAPALAPGEGSGRGIPPARSR